MISMDQLLNAARSSLTEMSVAVILANLLLTALMSLAIAWVYTKTHKSISYSRSYLYSLVMMSVLAATAMMILGNNLTRALGVLGVFTLIRFRTIVKDTKDATFLFFALSIGMAIGTNNYSIAIVSTIVLSALLLLLDRVGFGAYVGNAFLLTFTGTDALNAEELEKVIRERVEGATLLQVKSGVEQDRVYYYKVRLKHPESYHQFLDAVRKVPGIQAVDFVSGRDVAEY